jgi:hypothetical protein
MKYTVEMSLDALIQARYSLNKALEEKEENLETYNQGKIDYLNSSNIDYEDAIENVKDIIEPLKGL